MPLFAKKKPSISAEESPRTPQKPDKSSLAPAWDVLRRAAPPKEPISATTVAPPSDREAYAVILDNVLSAEECAALREFLDAGASWKQAEVNIGGGRQILDTDYRNSMRRIEFDTKFAAALFARIQPHLPERNPERSRGPNVPASRLNECCRFLKYTAEGKHFFAPHGDGMYIRDDHSELSRCTVMLYLSDVRLGGATQLLEPTASDDERSALHINVAPREGRVLIFDHHVYHAGQAVYNGEKVCMRTDVMYPRSDSRRKLTQAEQATVEEDRKKRGRKWQ